MAKKVCRSSIKWLDFLAIDLEDSPYLYRKFEFVCKNLYLSNYDDNNKTINERSSPLNASYMNGIESNVSLVEGTSFSQNNDSNEYIEALISSETSRGYSLKVGDYYAIRKPPSSD